MNITDIKKLTRERFNAFFGWARLPYAEFIYEELEWYSCQRETVLGVLFKDLIDEDYGFGVLGRDEALRFRCVDLKTSISKPNTARARLKKCMKKHLKTGKKSFPQGDISHNPVDLFRPVVDEAKFHPHFHLLLQQPIWIPARGILEEMMRHFEDIDGNFVEQFQTSGFDARLWELYLYAYIKEESLFLNKDYHSPDLIVEKFGKRVCIEAVTVNPTDGFNQEIIDKKPVYMKTSKEIEDLLKDYMPIKFGSPLYSKLSKKPAYWELGHVKGQPLVFAIADFHEPQSMVWSHSALWQYLYGVDLDFSFDDEGELIISVLHIDKHRTGKKEISSGFFFQENTENVSAVVSSNSGTLPKFNRMGKLAGFGSEDIRLHRIGVCHDHDPHAHLPRLFSFGVEQGEITESWAEGLNMFHNPRATHPVPKELFPSIAHHEYVDGGIVSSFPEFHPYSSMTYHFMTTSESLRESCVKSI